MSRSRVAVLLAFALVAAVPAARADGPADIHCAGAVTLAVTCATTHDTIQAAVDAASPGDAVLIGAGTYRETVEVPTDDLVIRGEDRNAVVLEGDADTQDFGIRITGRDVEVSNLTVHHYTNTGVFWVGTSGFHGRYVTAYDNGRYGVYALGSHTGVFETSYASGNADSGFYIGECNPCHAVIRDVDSHFNALGYSGTNASNDLVIEDSRWYDNGAGILPNTLDSEDLPPQCCIVIRNNDVRGSGNPDAPAEGVARAAVGIGIGISGGSFNVIEDNAIDGSTRFGVAIFPFPDAFDGPPDDSPNLYVPNGNVVRDNVITSSGMYDIALAAPSGYMNCFSRNTPVTSDPPAIESLYPCERVGSQLRNAPVSGGVHATANLAFVFATEPDRGDWRNAPAPAPQPTMPDPLEGLPS